VRKAFSESIVLHEVFYRVEEASIRVASNSMDWLEGLNSFLCLERIPLPSHDAIELTVLSAPESQLDDLIPLPEGRFLKSEGPSFLGSDSRFRIYAIDGILWSDWSGYGRIRTDRSAGKAMAAVNSETPWDPFLGFIIFGYNALMALLFRFGLCSVHASCVSIARKGILFTGDSGSGKSSAAFALMRRGHPMVSDDRALVFGGPSYAALNISDVFKIREEALHRLFPSLRATKPYHRAFDENYYKISALQGLRHMARTPLHAVVILEKTGERESEIKRVPPARVVRDLFPVTLNPHDPEQAAAKFTFLTEMLKHLPCYCAGFGTDMDIFAERIEKAVGQL
jgi:hypothetical protein